MRNKFLTKGLKNARSVNGRVFIIHESGENNCQFGNIGPAFDFIVNCIECQRIRT